MGPILSERVRCRARLGRPDCDREAAALPHVRQRGVLRLARLRALPDRSRHRLSDRRATGSRSSTSPPTSRASSATPGRCNWRAVGPGAAVLSQLRARRRRRARSGDVSMVPFQSAQRRALYQLSELGVPWGAGSELRFAYRSKSAGDARRHRPPQRRDHARPRRGRPGPAASASGPRSASTTARRSATSATSSGTSCGSRWWRQTPYRLGEFRDLFGDERVDYVAALDSHYGRIDDGSVARRPRLVLRLGPPVGGLRRVVGPADARPRRRRDRRRVGRRAAPPRITPTPRRG